MVSPALVMAGVLVHAILEGLAIGLQTSYSGVVIAFVAMASHKWVESIAISARFIKVRRYSLERNILKWVDGGTNFVPVPCGGNQTWEV